jgi:hypothetical protein
LTSFFIIHLLIQRESGFVVANDGSVGLAVPNVAKPGEFVDVLANRPISSSFDPPLPTTPTTTTTSTTPAQASTTTAFARTTTMWRAPAQSPTNQLAKQGSSTSSLSQVRAPFASSSRLPKPLAANSSLSASKPIVTSEVCSAIFACFFGR